MEQLSVCGFSVGSLRTAEAFHLSVCAVPLTQTTGCTSLKILEGFPKLCTPIVSSRFELSNSSVVHLTSRCRSLCSFFFLNADVSQLRLLLQRHLPFRSNSFWITSARHVACLRQENEPRVSVIKWRTKWTSAGTGLYLPCCFYRRMPSFPFL